MSKDYKSQIVIEVLGKYSETHKITYGIVAYSFFIRVSCLVSRFQYEYHYSLLYVSRSKRIPGLSRTSAQIMWPVASR